VVKQPCGSINGLYPVHTPFTVNRDIQHPDIAPCKKKQLSQVCVLPLVLVQNKYI